MLSPVWFEWHDGGINVWVRRWRRQGQHIVQRDPRVTFVVANQDWPYKGFELRGEATVSADDFYGVLRRTAPRYSGAEEAERMVSTYRAGRRDPGRPGTTARLGLRGRGLGRAAVGPPRPRTRPRLAASAATASSTRVSMSRL